MLLRNSHLLHLLKFLSHIITASSGPRWHQQLSEGNRYKKALWFHSSRGHRSLHFFSLLTSRFAEMLMSSIKKILLISPLPPAALQSIAFNFVLKVIYFCFWIFSVSLRLHKDCRSDSTQTVTQFSHDSWNIHQRIWTGKWQWSQLTRLLLSSSWYPTSV